MIILIGLNKKSKISVTISYATVPAFTPIFSLTSLDIKKEDAFRMVDIDFDGNISKQDLRHFLHNTLKINTEELHAVQIDRLFKLLDHFKRGSINLEDFSRIFDASPSEMDSTKKSQKGLKVHHRHKKSQPEMFGWKENAIQQIGLMLSKKFPDITSSFDRKESVVL